VFKNPNLGASFLFIKIGVQEMAPEMLVMLRLVIASVVLVGRAVCAVCGARVLITWSEQALPPTFDGSRNL